MIEIKRALISVSDKKGIIEFAKTLIKYKVEILSTGGTLAFIQELGIPVTAVEDVTQASTRLETETTNRSNKLQPDQKIIKLSYITGS